MPHRKNNKSHWDLDPQTAFVAQFLTYIASAGTEVYLIKMRSIFTGDKLPFPGR